MAKNKKMTKKWKILGLQKNLMPDIGLRNTMVWESFLQKNPWIKLKVHEGKDS